MSPPDAGRPPERGADRDHAGKQDRGERSRTGNGSQPPAPRFRAWVVCYPAHGATLDERLAVVDALWHELTDDRRTWWASAEARVMTPWWPTATDHALHHACTTCGAPAGQPCAASRAQIHAPRLTRGLRVYREHELERSTR